MSYQDDNAAAITRWVEDGWVFNALIERHSNCRAKV